MPGRHTISSTLAAAVIVATASLAWAQSSGSSGGGGGAGDAGGAGGAGAAGGAAGGAGATGAGTGGSASPAPGNSVPSGTGPAPAPTPGQSFSFPSNSARLAQTILRQPGPERNRAGAGADARPVRHAPIDLWDQQDRLPGSALDTTGVTGTRPGCRPSAADATAQVRAPRIANDPALGTGPTAETGGAGARASVDTGVGGNTAFRQAGAEGETTVEGKRLLGKRCRMPENVTLIAPTLASPGPILRA